MPIVQSSLSESEESMDEILPVQVVEASHRKPSPVATSAHVKPPQSPKHSQEAAQDSDDDMEEVPVTDGSQVHDVSESFVPAAVSVPVDAAEERRSMSPASFQLPKSLERPQPSTYNVVTPEARIPESDDESDIEWSRSPSPMLGTVPGSTDQGASAAVETWDAAEEMDPHAEEGEFARFISQVKGKDLDAVRHEIDEEIRTLNQQKKAAIRDSEDITQQMISQIMVCVPC